MSTFYVFILYYIKEEVSKHVHNVMLVYIHKSKKLRNEELMIMMMMLTKVLCIFSFPCAAATMAFNYGRYFFIYICINFSHLFF